MNERLSAWMDGELKSRHAHQLPLQLEHDAALRSTWSRYHLIGDIVRGVHGPDVYDRIRARLDAEPTMVAPKRRSAAGMRRWRPLQVAASIAAVGFVGWMALLSLRQDSPQIAAIPATETKQAAAPVGEDARDYLRLHQHYSPGNAILGVAPYVRTVAAEWRTEAW